MRDTAGEVGTSSWVMSSCGHLHIDEQRQDIQFEPTYMYIYIYIYICVGLYVCVRVSVCMFVLVWFGLFGFMVYQHLQVI